MTDGLHVYPSGSLLLWAWGTGVVLQVIAHVCWRAYRHERQSQNHRYKPVHAHEQELEQGESEPESALVARDRRMSSDEPTLSTRRHSMASAESPKRTSFDDAGMPTGQTLPAHLAHNNSDAMSFPWKQLAYRSAVATLLLALLSVATSTVMLYLRTGSYVEQPYEWYSLEKTGARLFSATMPLPRDILKTCKFLNASAAHTEMRTLDNVIAQYKDAPPPHTLVHVVPFDYNHVLELQLGQVVPVLEPLPSLWKGGAAVSDATYNGSFGALTPASDFVKAKPVDEITLFPYLWHSLLGPQLDPRVAAPSTEPWTRVVRSLDLEFRLVRSDDELRDLPQDSNLLVVAPALESVKILFEGDKLPPEPRVGFLSLTKENCNNPEPERLLDNAAIKFGLITYGDCALVDGERFVSVPLGPSFEHGFPVNAHLLPVPPPPEVGAGAGLGRKYLLNLMVSWTIEKPTRVQAMIAALQVCSDLETATRANSRRCVVEHNDMLFKALQAVDKKLGTAWRWYLSAAPNAYVATLQQSVFTLCPLGKNPEQYRIWEALAAGSIPIVEELQPQCQPPGVFYHPAYPDSWRCVPEDVHGVLHRLDAPVLFVSDWKRDLPKLMAGFFSRPSTATQEDGGGQWGEWTPTPELLALQARTRPWYVSLGRHLQQNLLDKVMRHFSPEARH